MQRREQALQRQRPGAVAPADGCSRERSCEAKAQYGARASLRQFQVGRGVMYTGIPGAAHGESRHEICYKEKRCKPQRAQCPRALRWIKKGTDPYVLRVHGRLQEYCALTKLD